MAGIACVVLKTTQSVAALFANASNSQGCTLEFSAFRFLPRNPDRIANCENHKKLARFPPPVPEPAETLKLS